MFLPVPRKWPTNDKTFKLINRFKPANTPCAPAQVRPEACCATFNLPVHELANQGLPVCKVIATNTSSATRALNHRSALLATVFRCFRQLHTSKIRVMLNPHSGKVDSLHVTRLFGNRFNCHALNCCENVHWSEIYKEACNAALCRRRRTQIFAQAIWKQQCNALRSHYKMHCF
jgi:hypothetical protein